MYIVYRLSHIAHAAAVEEEFNLSIVREAKEVQSHTAHTRIDTIIHIDRLTITDNRRRLEPCNVELGAGWLTTLTGLIKFHLK